MSELQAISKAKAKSKSNHSHSSDSGDVSSSKHKASTQLGSFYSAGPILSLSSLVQAKVTIGHPNDQYEHEANTVAETITNGREVPSISRISSYGQGSFAQRKEEPVQTLPVQLQVEEEEEPVQTLPIQRQADQEEEPVQTLLVQRQADQEEEPVQTLPVQRQAEEEEKEEEEELVQTKPISDEITPQIQRQEAAEEEEELVQAKPITEQTPPLIQRQAERAGEEEKEEVVQPRSETNTTSSDPVRYVQRAVAWIQAKLRIGQPGDRYEQEADRVAEQVMRMPKPRVQRQPIEAEEEEEIQTKPVIEQITPLVQKQVKKEEKEQVQTKPITEQITPLVQVQRQKKPEDEETLQAKSLSEEITPLGQRQIEPVKEEEELQAKATSGHLSEVNSNLESQIQSLKGGGQPLSENERAFFEPRFGRDFSQVRLHTDTRAAESARAVNARAFTMGRDVVFGEGQYEPGKVQGRRLIGHELTHVVQQNMLSRGCGYSEAARGKQLLAQIPVLQQTDGNIRIIQREPDDELTKKKRHRLRYGPAAMRKHHLIPQEINRYRRYRRFAHRLADMGVDIHQKIIYIPNQLHKKVHQGPRGGKWNSEMIRWFRKNPNFTRVELESHLKEMKRKYNIPKSAQTFMRRYGRKERKGKTLLGRYKRRKRGIKGKRSTRSITLPPAKRMRTRRKKRTIKRTPSMKKPSPGLGSSPKKLSIRPRYRVRLGNFRNRMKSSNRMLSAWNRSIRRGGRGGGQLIVVLTNLAMIYLFGDIERKFEKALLKEKVELIKKEVFYSLVILELVTIALKAKNPGKPIYLNISITSEKRTYFEADDGEGEDYDIKLDGVRVGLKNINTTKRGGYQSGFTTIFYETQTQSVELDVPEIIIPTHIKEYLSELENADTSNLSNIELQFHIQEIDILQDLVATLNSLEAFPLSKDDDYGYSTDDYRSIAISGEIVNIIRGSLIPQLEKLDKWQELKESVIGITEDAGMRMADIEKEISTIKFTPLESLLQKQEYEALARVIFLQQGSETVLLTKEEIEKLSEKIIAEGQRADIYAERLDTLSADHSYLAQRLSEIEMDLGYTDQLEIQKSLWDERQLIFTILELEKRATLGNTNDEIDALLDKRDRLLEQF